MADLTCERCGVTNRFVGIRINGTSWRVLCRNATACDRRKYGRKR